MDNFGIFGHVLTFSGHLVDIPFSLAVRRYAHYNPIQTCSHTFPMLQNDPQDPSVLKILQRSNPYFATAPQSFTIRAVFLSLFLRKPSISEHSPYCVATAIVNLLPVPASLSIVLSIQ